MVNLSGGFDVIGGHRYLEEVTNGANGGSMTDKGVISASVSNENFQRG